MASFLKITKAVLLYIAALIVLIGVAVLLAGGGAVIQLPGFSIANGTSMAAGAMPAGIAVALIGIAFFWVVSRWRIEEGVGAHGVAYGAST